MAYFDLNLPHSVEAIIDDGYLHAQFVETYGVDPHDYPLVRFEGSFRDITPS